jgi:4-hydroxybenzoate polyprenyltransferase
VTLLWAIVRSLRPRQWAKNLFVFAGLVFSQQLLTPSAWTAGAAFLLFCALSGAIYLLNDVVDAEKDRLHPEKRRRPVASGALPRAVALWVGVGLIAVALVLSFRLSWEFGLVAATYAVLLTAYSVWLKRLVILDVLTVAIGFVLRAVAGAVAIGVDISGWLLICTVLVALFLALGSAPEYLRSTATPPRSRSAEYREL